jgi:modulator of FtsH protease
VYDVNTAVDAVVSTNKVLRNTYMLLGMTLLFSAMTAASPWPWVCHRARR